MKPLNRFKRLITIWALLPIGMLILLGTSADIYGAMLYKNYVVRYDRGWDILCDPYQVQRGDWVLKIFRQKGEIANQDFREFLGIFQRLNPHVKDIDRIRPGQVVDIPLKKLAQGNLPGQSSGVVTIPFVMLNNPKEMIEKHTQTYTIQRGDTVSKLIANRFGGRYGNLTYTQGLQLFKAANPQIKDINRIYAGQKIYMPDPSIRQQSWYDNLFDETGNLVDKAGDEVARRPEPAQPAVTAVAAQRKQPAAAENLGPAAEAAAVMGGRLLNKGTYFLPMKQGADFELDLSRHPMIDLPDGKKVILTTQDRVMNVDLPLVQSYWDNINAVKIPEAATSQDILEAVLSAFKGEETTDQLAFDDGGINIRVSAKWIRSEPSADGSVPRHTCITPIAAAEQQTHAAVVRYLEQNDILIKDILAANDAAAPTPAPMAMVDLETIRIDGSSQKALIASFAELMGFRYSPNTSISFPYAGIQVKALSNLLSFGSGKEILIDFGDLYGDAVNAIQQTGLEIIQIDVESGSADIIERLLGSAGMSYTRSPVLYGANRPAEFNTAITVDGILVPTTDGQNRLFGDRPLPELIELFIRDQGIQWVRIQENR